MTIKKLAILGSTGSIGLSTLKVLRDRPGAFEVVAMAAYGKIEALENQYLEFRPKYLCLVDDRAAGELATRLRNEPVEVLAGADELVQLAGLDEVDIVLNAVVGAAGLRASVEAVQAGKQLALANKESLVAGGPLFADVCRQDRPQILPVDSEHSAVWQCLRAGKRSEVERIILTASGGPFRTLDREQFSQITPEQALDHPTWKMGPKISIDSATLFNKGLELLEAVILFDMEPGGIKVVIHPQSVVHSMVEFVDGAVIAQMSEPDMCLPIVHALFWPERVRSNFGTMDWREHRELSFEPPDLERFPALKLAYDVAGIGGTGPAVYSAANEVAVESFLDGRVKFTEIAAIVRRTLDEMEILSRPDLDDIFEADRLARETAGRIREKLKC